MRYIIPSILDWRLHVYPIIIFLASRWGKISFKVLGLLSSKTILEYHLEPKAVNCIKRGSVSFPFAVSCHWTIIGDLLSSMHSIKSSFSSSFKRIERTLGVRPWIDSKIRLKRFILRTPISLIIRRVHFLPRIPKLVLIGHFTNFTWGHKALSSRDDSCSWLLMYCLNYTLNTFQTYKL